MLVLKMPHWKSLSTLGGFVLALTLVKAMILKAIFSDFIAQTLNSKDKH